MPSTWNDRIERAKKFCIRFLASSSIAAASKSLCAPLDRVKIILQNQDSSIHIIQGKRKRYVSMYDAFKRIPKEQGFYSLWRGNFTNVLRYIPTQGLNFAFNDHYNEYYKRWHLRHGDKPSPFSKVFMGGLAGISSCCICYPLEFCYSRLSVDAGDGKLVEREFKNLRDCVVKVCRSDGIVGPYRGLTCNLVGIAMYRSLYFGLYDYGKHLLSHSPNCIIENPDHTAPPKIKVAYAFAIAQIATTTSGLASYPFDTMGRRMMLQSGRPYQERQFHSYSEGMRFIFNEEGIPSFYKGAGTNVIRSVCGAMVLVIYDQIKHGLEI